MKASRTRYSVVALAIGLAVLSYVQRVAISQAAGPISHDLHLNKAQMGLVFGAFGLSYALFEIPIGLLGDRIGVRRVLLQIVLGWSVFTALTGAAWNVLSLWIIRFLFGAGEAGCFPILTRMLSVWLPVVLATAPPRDSSMLGPDTPVKAAMSPTPILMMAVTAAVVFCTNRSRPRDASDQACRACSATSISAGVIWLAKPPSDRKSYQMVMTFG